MSSCAKTFLFLQQKALEDKTNIESARLINNKVEGTTPLIIACRLGNLMMVKYLIETRAADLKLCGSVNFDGEVIEGKTEVFLFLQFSTCCSGISFINTVTIALKR